MRKVEDIINHLKMNPHHEGGFFKLLYEDAETICKDCLPGNFEAARSLWNAIYYLLPRGSKSIFHRIRMTEMWNFYLGESLELYDLSPTGNLKKIILGKDIFNGEQLTYVVPKGHWMAAKPSKDSSYCLVSCVTCPGFTFSDWEKGDREEMIKLYPSFKEIIIELTD